LEFPEGRLFMLELVVLKMQLTWRKKDFKLRNRGRWLTIKGKERLGSQPCGLLWLLPLRSRTHEGVEIIHID